MVLFIGDNGRCYLRGKCWLYDPGLKVLLIIKWQKIFDAGKTNTELISMIDISATILEAAGAELPEYLDGHPIYGPNKNSITEIYASRDLIDEVMDHIRCVRIKKYKYIRNYTPVNGYNECGFVKRNRPMLAVIQELDK